MAKAPKKTEASKDREAVTDALIALDNSDPSLNRSLGVPDDPKADDSVTTTKFAELPANSEPEPKVGKVEARLAALEAYVARNVKALGWPEFEG